MRKKSCSLSLNPIRISYVIRKSLTKISKCSSKFYIILDRGAATSSLKNQEKFKIKCHVIKKKKKLRASN